MGRRKKQQHPSSIIRNESPPSQPQSDSNDGGLSSPDSRPKRRASNLYAYRYLQTGNPTKLEENDLKRALEASLEGCPSVFSASSRMISQQSSNSSSSSTTSSSSSITGGSRRNSRTRSPHSRSRTLTNSTANAANSINLNCPPRKINKIYRPVAKKNIYEEADFFHKGIMEYIDYYLARLDDNRKAASTKQERMIQDETS